MRRKNLAFLLACVGLLFAAAASAPAAIQPAPVAGVTTVDGVDAPHAVDGPLNEPDACPPLPPATGEQFTPMACRIKPECSTDDDCAAICGPNGGHCVHSRCPIRICKCS
jgi:hypothetical protein